MPKQSMSVETQIAQKTGTRVTQTYVTLVAIGIAFSAGALFAVSVNPYKSVKLNKNVNTSFQGGKKLSGLVNTSLDSLAFRRGDVNIDGKVDISDISRMREVFNNPNIFPCKDAADVNDDGRIDQSDLIFLISWFSSGGKEPPSPGPFTPGTDPTNDTLKCSSYPQTLVPIKVSLDAIPASKNIVPGTQDVEFARIVFDASKTTQDVIITKVTIVIRDRDAMPGMVRGIELFDNNRKIAVDSAVQKCSGATCSAINSQAANTLSLSPGSLKIPKNTTKIVRIVGDIGTATTTGSFAMYLNEGNIEAINQNGERVIPNIISGKSSSMYFLQGGTLNVKIHTEKNLSSLVIAGSKSIVGTFSLKANFEDIRIHALGFDLLSPDKGIVGDEREIDVLELWEQGGSIALGVVTINSKRATITPSVPIILTMGQEKTFILRSIFTPIIPGSPARSGAGISLYLSYLDAKGASLGSSSVSVVLPSNIFNTFTVVKSKPEVTILPFNGTDTITGNALMNLMKFSVRADSAGPVGLTKFTFGISTTTVELRKDGYYLYESNSPNIEGNLLSNNNDFTFDRSSRIVGARFDVGNNNPPHYDKYGLGDHLIIGAGSVTYFTLKGTTLFHDGVTDNESISVALAGDDMPAGTRPLNALDVDIFSKDNDFIWSDLSFGQYSSSSAPQTLGWFNGFRVPGLELTSSTPQTLTD